MFAKDRNVADEVSLSLTSAEEPAAVIFASSGLREQSLTSESDDVPHN
jgi:hypothetical protein